MIHIKNFEFMCISSIFINTALANACKGNHHVIFFNERKLRGWPLTLYVRLDAV